MIRPQVTSLLKTCQTIETTIPTNTNLDLESDEYVVTSEANKRTCRDVLYEEQCTLLDSLDTYYSDKDEDKDNFDEAKKMTKQIPFLNKKLNLDRFVPNTYKRMPMMMCPQAVDKDSIFMHSMRLLAAKDVQNEELFYDYRLSSGSDESHPKWYSIINKEELDNRWHHKD